MRGSGWVNQALGVTDASKMREKLQLINELGARLGSP